MKKKGTLYILVAFITILFCGEIKLSAQNLVRIYPCHGSQNVNPFLNIQFQFDENPEVLVALFEKQLKVTGNNNKNYTGKIVLTAYNTLLFLPDETFFNKDTIHLSLNDSKIINLKDNYNFIIRDKKIYDECLAIHRNKLKKETRKSSLLSVKKKLSSQTSIPHLINGIAVPADLPEIIPSINNETAPGYLFLDNVFSNPYLLIYKNDGTPVYYRKMEFRPRDFKLQKGGILTTGAAPCDNGYLAYDQNYNYLKSYISKGYQTDYHDLQIQEDGTAYLLALDFRKIDMSQLVEGGLEEAIAYVNVIQQIDQNGNVIFEWSTWDNFSITDAIYQDLKILTIDYVHLNSIAIDYDGNILISSRHQSELTKINRETGELVWRLGGKNNMFEFVDSDRFSYQHDLRPVPEKPDHYTIFDNGTNRPRNEYSRALEFRIDTENKKLYKVWEYRANPDLFSESMGNVQRLPNGNTLINWGSKDSPKVTEINPQSEVVYECDFNNSTSSYRSFRFEWEGFSTIPEIIAEKYSDKLLLIFNKFGDNNIESYNIYYGENNNADKFLVNTDKNYLILTAGSLSPDKTYSFLVKVVYKDGAESPASNTVNSYFDFTLQGNNLIKNGTFDAALNNWNFLITEEADALVEINDEKSLFFNIQNGSNDISAIQITQNNIPLIKGEKYLLEYDAITETSREIEVKLSQKNYPFTNYSKSGLSYINSRNKHFEIIFDMEESTNFSSQLIINTGNSDQNVWIDNLSLKNISEGTSISDNKTMNNCFITYPNPAKDKITLEFDTGEDINYYIDILNLRGEIIKSLLLKTEKSRRIKKLLSCKELVNGIYYIKLSSRNSVYYSKFLIMK